MKKSANKRAPQGATKAIVLMKLWQLHAQRGEREGVYRSDLLDALALKETTVDDRLRTLVKEGQVVRVGWGEYAPKPMHGMDFGQVERAQALQELKSEPTQPPGTSKITRFPNGAIRTEKWF